MHNNDEPLIIIIFLLSHQAFVKMSVPLDSTAVIRYTTDGSDPVSTSAVYTGTPVSLSAAASYLNVSVYG